ncbi:Dehydrogenase/reductase SDR family member 11 [Dufourea novaeangliae]|uniref:Dehydrogenase/reductase SDR family member 11 n=1 Tax=Dufourea novaeangliae TaxID=178035 RepID=A0A154PHR7_DUFNO|nr:Dehydrogenase/reductase SDR family member 11 [Dufourea novaeangliae]
MERWSGKVAIVTGASSGIGAEITESLVEHGVKVVTLARRLNKLEELAANHGKDKIYPVQCDVTKEEEILQAFQWVEEKLGGADILVNNAGVLIATPVIDYRRVVDTNLIAPAICSREFCQSVKKRNAYGHIININSMAGHYAEAIQLSLGIYGASKYGLTALTVELRNEILQAKLRIRITNISPGTVLTDMFTNVAAGQIDLNNKMIILRGKDIANSVVYALGTPEGAESISPGAVMTDMLRGIAKLDSLLDKIPTLSAEDVADAVMYALGTPQGVEGKEGSWFTEVLEVGKRHTVAMRPSQRRTKYVAHVGSPPGHAPRQANLPGIIFRHRP